MQAVAAFAIARAKAFSGALAISRRVGVAFEVAEFAFALAGVPFSSPSVTAFAVLSRAFPTPRVASTELLNGLAFLELPLPAIPLAAAVRRVASSPTSEFLPLTSASMASVVQVLASQCRPTHILTASLHIRRPASSATPSSTASSAPAAT